MNWRDAPARLLIEVLGVPDTQSSAQSRLAVPDERSSGMFLREIRGHALPKYLSSGHDPLYRFHQVQANLRVPEVTEIKTVPYVPLSHPFVERLIGAIRRELLFWTPSTWKRTHRLPALL